MLYALICLYKPGGAELRKPLRARHLEHMIAALPFTAYGGPLFAGEEQSGMLVILDVQDRSAAERFLVGEPYYTAGLFETAVIRRWSLATPEPEPEFLRRELQRELEMTEGS